MKWWRVKPAANSWRGGTKTALPTGAAVGLSTTIWMRLVAEKTLEDDAPMTANIFALKNNNKLRHETPPEIEWETTEAESSGDDVATPVTNGGSSSRGGTITYSDEDQMKIKKAWWDEEEEAEPTVETTDAAHARLMGEWAALQRDISRRKAQIRQLEGNDDIGEEAIAEKDDVGNEFAAQPIRRMVNLARRQEGPTAKRVVAEHVRLFLARHGLTEPTAEDEEEGSGGDSESKEDTISTFEPSRAEEEQRLDVGVGDDASPFGQHIDKEGPPMLLGADGRRWKIERQR